MGPERLLADEEAAWARLRRIVAAIPPERFDELRATEDGWSAKDELAHLAAWLERCAVELERIAAGEAPGEAPGGIGRFNRDRYERARAMTLSEVEEDLARARDRARRALARLPEVDARAWTWFEESGALHYAAHAERLLAFVDQPAPPEGRGLPVG